VDIVELGVQSFDEEVLQRSQRGYPPETVRRASALITRFGFTLGHQLMVGLPGDTAEKDLQSVRESIALHPKLIRIYPALILRGTAMEELYQKGEYAPYDLEEAVKICAQMLDAYEEAGIPVIRMGLQPTEEINENAQVLAGPFHPAFRELVESYRLCRRVETFGGRAVTLTVGKRDLSKLYAGKKRYFAPLAEKLTIKVKVVDASLPQIIHLERREDRSVL
jgi:histone acetyltransferase (RNA polymerase elongator complex component)